MKRLLLIDGNAILHRAYHALPPLTNPKGEVVNAVYGFFSMFLTVMADMKPSHVVVCFDRPKPTFRQTLYAGYQQHRPKMADDLVPQIGWLHEALQKMGVAIFEVDGYEADDLIGTIAAQAVINQESGIRNHESREIPNSKSQIPNKSKIQSSKIQNDNGEEGIEVVIVSGDRDLLQLVNSQVKMLAPVTGVKNTILYDSTKVEEKFGVSPKQIVDYKALVGDASDGYPGVSGIGPKTAAQLLQTFRTLEGIYEHIGEINPKVGAKLAQDSEQAGLCKKLATIITDAPITLKLEECEFEKLSEDGLRKAFEEQGFKSLAGRVEAVFKLNIKNEKLNMKKEPEKKKKENGQLGLLE